MMKVEGNKRKKRRKMMGHQIGGGVKKRSGNDQQWEG